MMKEKNIDFFYLICYNYYQGTLTKKIERWFMEFKKFNPADFSNNPFLSFDRDWALLTAGTADKFNMMTISWGGIGVIWGKNVATVYVRHSRHTFGFIESNNRFTVSFYPEKFRNALNICGSQSGRDIDKAKTAGLSPIAVPNAGAVTFSESNLTLVCRKLFAKDLDKSGFIDTGLYGEIYPDDSIHRMYIGEIELLGN
jgi:flavin reductase (DIM6/NTAB) family NADH-FMN oxidoreductase RutF